MAAPRALRPLPRGDMPRPAAALPLAGGRLWFDCLVEHRRGAPAREIGLADLSAAERTRLSAPRPPLAGIDLCAGPRLMGILNVTPDSFSDGGTHLDPDVAVTHGTALRAAGADILDVGGESTRPGAVEVPAGAEIDRIAPVIAALAAEGGPVSVDTRKAAVAQAAFAAGAGMLNDVSALGFDPAMAAVAAGACVPVCLMHARGRPDTMQDDPRYDDVILDVFEALHAAVLRAEAAGIARARLVLDPGIGFGKTLAHNLALLRHLAVFHSLGCPLLVGASRKRFIGLLSGVDSPRGRLPGSLAAALAAVAQGVQVLRVHDVAETRQALDVHLALTGVAEGAVERQTERSGQ